MDENRQITIAEWQQWKQEIKDRLNQTVENFIAIGYRLRMIQDTEAYRNDGFMNLADWARSEFGLSESTITRFMAINAKFTVEGRGTELLPEFRGISYSKLQEMLTLSDEDCKLITSGTTVKEIRELKQFNHDDEAKYIRTEEEKAKRTPLQECIWDFFAQPGNKGLLDETMEAMQAGDDMAKVAVIADNISPSGNRTHRKGIVYLFMYDAERGVAYKLMTSPMPVKLTWEAFLEEVRFIYAEYMGTGGSVWQAAYGREAGAEAEITGQMDITEVIHSEAPAEDAVKQKEQASYPATSQETENLEDEGGKPEKEALKEPENITYQAEIVQDADKSAIFRPADRQAGGTGEEATNAETDAPGESGNSDDMPDGTDRDGAIGQPGDAEGVDRAAETPEAGTGSTHDTGTGENTESVINPEYRTVSGMTDRDWANLWYAVDGKVTHLYTFFSEITEPAFRNNEIPKEKLEKQYRAAIDVAAGLEKMINGKKYSAQ